MNNCPCGSGIEYNMCCGPYLTGRKSPGTALCLMRSRYTAYVKNDISYIINTHLPDSREGFSFEDLTRWAESCKWIGLTILSTENGRAEHKEGIVEFKAHYMQSGSLQVHHEVSRFSKKGGKWYYEANLTDSVKSEET